MVEVGEGDLPVWADLPVGPDPVEVGALAPLDGLPGGFSLLLGLLAGGFASLLGFLAFGLAAAFLGFLAQRRSR